MEPFHTAVLQDRRRPSDIPRPNVKGPTDPHCELNLQALAMSDQELLFLRASYSDKKHFGAAAVDAVHDGLLIAGIEVSVPHAGKCDRWISAFHLSHSAIEHLRAGTEKVDGKGIVH